MGGNKKKPSGSSDKTVQLGPGGAEIKPAAEEKKKAKPQQKQKLAVVVEEPSGMMMRCQTNSARLCPYATTLS